MRTTSVIASITALGLLALISIDQLDRAEVVPLPPLTTTLPKYQEIPLRPTEANGDITESTTEAPTTTVEPTTTTSTTLPDTKCAEWWPTADLVGWTLDEWDTLSEILWRESRCRPEAHNPTDPNGGSYGLTQINGFWIDYLCQHWEICHPNELYDPQINLASAWVIYNYSVVKNGCGFHPWRTPC